jgi:hypothetical protein
MPFRARTLMCSMVSLKRSRIKPLGPPMPGHSGNLSFVPVTLGAQVVNVHVPAKRRGDPPASSPIKE